MTVKMHGCFRFLQRDGQEIHILYIMKGNFERDTIAILHVCIFPSRRRRDDDKRGDG